MNYLAEHGIDSKIHYPIAIHQQEAAAYNKSAKENYPIPINKLVKF